MALAIAREVSLARLGPTHRESWVMDRDNCVPACRLAAGAPFIICTRRSPTVLNASTRHGGPPGHCARSYTPKSWNLLRKVRGHVRGRPFTRAAMKEHGQPERWRPRQLAGLRGKARPRTSSVAGYR